MESEKNQAQNLRIPFQERLDLDHSEGPTNTFKDLEVDEIASQSQMPHSHYRDMSLRNKSYIYWVAT